MTEDQLGRELLTDIFRKHLPVTLTISKKDGKVIKAHFDNLQAARDFADFIQELVASVKAKTLEDAKK